MNRLVPYIWQLLRTIEEVSDWRFICQYSAYNPQDVECRPLEFAVVLNDGNQTVCDNRNIDLYPHSILGVAPKGRHAEMLFYPSEKKLHLPSLFIQQGYVTGLDCKVVGQEREGPLQFRGIVNDPSERTRILLFGQIARKAYLLVKQDIIRAFEQVFAVDNVVVEARLLPDDKERVDQVDPVQPGKVIIPFVKDVERIRLIWNVIHRIHIVDFRFRDMNVGRDLGHNVKQRVYLDAPLGLSEVSPLEQAQAEINGCGVKRIELSTQDELPVKPLALCKVDHIVGELLEYPVIPVGIGIGNIAKLDVSATKSEMVTLILDGINDADDFPEAITAGELPEHHYKELVPACESLHILVPAILLGDSIKYSLWQKFNELTEKVFSAIHTVCCFIQTANMRIQFKSTRAIFTYKTLYINQLQRFM